MPPTKETMLQNITAPTDIGSTSPLFFKSSLPLFVGTTGGGVNESSVLIGGNGEFDPSGVAITVSVGSGVAVTTAVAVGAIVASGVAVGAVVGL